ncbi:hypothetical protein [Salicibibacter halophilus]|uniref:hypothetical protein n=1 Tax=Salicibibacter halophilus TaxID=2502791 RepID=UPI00135B46AF|nr:hypothetical protein [Salicibibacter halophilus]
MADKGFISADIMPVLADISADMADKILISADINYIDAGRLPAGNCPHCMP